jgi:hypothetical protein
VTEEERRRGPSREPGNRTVQAWQCGARLGSSGLGGNTPDECNWPCCSCDPYAVDVIAALQEHGALAPSEADELRRQVRDLQAQLVECRRLRAETGDGPTTTTGGD